MNDVFKLECGGLLFFNIFNIPKSIMLGILPKILCFRHEIRNQHRQIRNRRAQIRNWGGPENRAALPRTGVCWRSI